MVRVGDKATREYAEHRWRYSLSHYGAFTGRSARPKEGQRSCAPIPGKSQVQHLNRIGRRIIMWMLLIAALAVIWNLLDERGRQLLSQCQVEAKSRWARYIALKKNLMVRVRLSPM
jgi:hypothetical protein